jgi:uncharacterized protein (TIGR00297 family)
VALLYGIGLSAIIALTAYRRGSLTVSGALAGVGVGACIFVGAGWRGFAALVTFFVTSTLLARVGRAAKAATKREFSKGDRRDAWQVLANGGVAAAAALGMLADPRLGAALLGALATANGDTWATELGVLSRGEPISLVSGRRVARGTSGAVSGLGMAATAAGAALIGAVYEGAGGAIAGAIAGTIGALADSLLGATLQASYWCAACERGCEAEVHHCGARGRLQRGFAWAGNDLVNLLATIAGAAAALAIRARR